MFSFFSEAALRFFFEGQSKTASVKIAVVPCLGGPLLTKFVVWRQPAGGGGGDGTAEQEPVVFEIEPSAETTAAVSGQRIEEDTRTVMDILEGVSGGTRKAPRKFFWKLPEHLKVGEAKRIMRFRKIHIHGKLEIYQALLW